jgi:acyl-CoA synthetase (AMP-forming)/AMP-acid ligase II
MTLSIRAHHGSPGGPGDFLAFTTLLDRLQWQNYSRYETKDSSADKAPELQLGFSWGCAYALAAAVKNPNTQALFLISPYLFHDGVGTLKKLLLKSPLGDVLLRQLAPKAVESYLKKSLHPAPVTDEHRTHAKSYMAPAILKQALLEKDDFNRAQILANLKILNDRNIPLVVFYGEEDQTSSLSAQIMPLQKSCPDLQLIKFQQAGHALVGTKGIDIAQYLSIFTSMLEQGLPLQADAAQLPPIGYATKNSRRNNIYCFMQKHLQNIPHRPILAWVDAKVLEQWKGAHDASIEHKSVSVAELDKMINVLSRGLSNLGVTKGDRAIVFLPMGPALYSTMFALQKIGAVAVFLDSWARKDQLGVSAEIASPKLIITGERAYDYMLGVKEIDQIPIKIVAGPHQRTYDAKLEDLFKTRGFENSASLDREDTALITFTTGSSGRPKGADRSHRFLAAQHYALNRHLPYYANDIDLPVFPIFSLNNLAAGVTTVIPAIDVGVQKDSDAALLVAQILHMKVTCTTLSPSLLNAVSAYCLKNTITLPGLRRVITGGAPVGRDDVRRIKAACPNAEILVLYGSTEVEPMAHIESHEMLNQVSRADTDPDWVEEGVNVGKMDSGLQTRFIKISKDPVVIKSSDDWEHLLVAEGQVGEIIVSGEHVCEKYYNDATAFSRSKIRDEHGRVWHRTGDLGKFDDNGNLWLVGRAHNAIDRAGVYYFPVRAEFVMKKLPQVYRSAYLGMPDKILGESTWAVAALKPESKQDTKEAQQDIIANIRRLLDKNDIVADHILLVDEIPMDPRHHSKVEYEVLRQKILHMQPDSMTQETHP